MPIYEYRCKGCGRVFEAVVLKGEDEKIISCPRCGKNQPERLMSAFSAKSLSASVLCTSFR